MTAGRCGDSANRSVIAIAGARGWPLPLTEGLRCAGLPGKRRATPPEKRIMLPLDAPASPASVRQLAEAGLEPARTLRPTGF